MLNKVILMGRLTADPEYKTIQNGVACATFRLAVERNYAAQGQQRQADFISCVAWRQTADFVAKYFLKGQMLALEGSLQSRQYEDKQGQKRTAYEVIVSQVYFVAENKPQPQKRSEETPLSAAPSHPANDPYAPPGQYGLPGNVHYNGTLDTDLDDGDLPY